MDHTSLSRAHFIRNFSNEWGGKFPGDCCGISPFGVLAFWVVVAQTGPHSFLPWAYPEIICTPVPKKKGRGGSMSISCQEFLQNRPFLRWQARGKKSLKVFPSTTPEKEAVFVGGKAPSNRCPLPISGWNCCCLLLPLFFCTAERIRTRTKPTSPLQKLSRENVFS